MIDKGIVYNARHTDLADYFNSKGCDVERQGLRYKIRGFGGLFVYNSCFYQHSTDLYGNSIDCLMKVFDMDFKDAVAELTGSATNFNIHEYDAKMEKKIKGDFNFSDIILNKDQHRAFAYLTKSRLIDKKVIQFLLRHKLLYQDHKGNCVFPFYDENGKIVGAELVGTLTDYRFKGNSKNSKEGYGFSIKFGLEDIYFFESAIDLLSYICLYSKSTDFSKSTFISMGGLKGITLFNYYFHFGEIPTYHVCVDNDEKGERFYERVATSIEELNRIVPRFKDWNKDLELVV